MTDPERQTREGGMMDALRDVVRNANGLTERVWSVADAIGDHPVGAGLRATINPVGEGVFVYHPDTVWAGVRRVYMWLVLDNLACPLNGASKNLTPDLPWPRDVGGWRARTGLNPHSAADAIRLVFGGGA